MGVPSPASAVFWSRFSISTLTPTICWADIFKSMSSYGSSKITVCHLSASVRIWSSNFGGRVFQTILMLSVM